MRAKRCSKVFHEPLGEQGGAHVRDRTQAQWPLWLKSVVCIRARSRGRRLPRAIAAPDASGHEGLPALPVSHVDLIDIASVLVVRRAPTQAGSFICNTQKSGLFLHLLQDGFA